MASRAGSSLSPLVLGTKWCDAAYAAPALRCAFSTTPIQSRRSKAQHRMFDFLKKRGSRFQDAEGQGPNYLGGFDQPFPMNPFFKSEPVLSEALREEVFRRVKTAKESLKLVSAELGIDVRRVAAVVRMMEIEKQWITERKPLARPYAQAVMGMLPQTPFAEQETGGQQIPHEPVNEIHVHKLTMQQLFVPVSESRQFNREDAAKAFHRNMLSIDDRSPHKELIDMRRAAHNGGDRKELTRKFRADTRAQEDRLIERERKRSEKAEEETTRVDTGRFEFRFKEMNVETVGKNGRSRGGVGWRYGVPFYDRRKGEVKIPTSVP
ncbi:eukaryotic mitochondrial regulator protein-domain-containing protein [Colletotrichum godetiae]|uniref:Eukaryotic mitochondrial regulator protein-domain-containing protein n=1 Tax=Colletotrichum godetiae TaxID=1209918 RepID=A0AAJ0EU65_9PEZI|nr:eukaryotic mitochondrial regulator protein-domain-containing protein [Colletotrichum godetiae]KAK1671980.1 eukaryotic mitochondrial regulator protein-domain-containing protein [Colletotrichum godetiae]